MFKAASLATVSVTALLAAAPCAIGQTAVTQGATNDGAVNNRGFIQNWPVGPMGAGASVAVGATGAATVLSVSGINQDLAGPNGGFGAIDQTSANNPGSTGATVTNNGLVQYNGVISGQGASASISATGAVASVGITGIGNQPFVAPAIGGPISQRSSNSAAVSSAFSSIFSSGDLAGAGASASVGASGAVTAVGVMFVGAASVTGSPVGNITQRSTNAQDASGQPASIDTLASRELLNYGAAHLSGDGASIGYRATGAAASVSVSQIDTVGAEGSFRFGNIDQSASNTSSWIRNGFIRDGVPTDYPFIRSGDLTGKGSSVSVAATGAVASVGSSSIGAGTGGSLSFGTVAQTAVNSDSSIYNAIGIWGGGLIGDGSSVSISASGAIASVGFGSIGAAALGTGPTVGTITQTARNVATDGSASSITNVGDNEVYGGITGAGASASVSAVGAGTYVSFSNLRFALAGTAVTQTASNDAQIINNGYVVTSSGLMGPGASAAVGATGAAAVVSVSAINQGLDGPAGSFGNITQSASNNTNGTGASVNSRFSGVDGSGDTALGQGSSMSVTASGAVASVGFTGIGSVAFITPNTGNVTQSANNMGSVSTYSSGSIVNGALRGDGASLSVGASGATASVGATFVGASSVAGGAFGNVTQTSINSPDTFGTPAVVDNTGSFVLGGPLLRAGANSSMRATGAAASVSIAQISTAGAEGSFTIGAIDQTAGNSGSLIKNGSYGVTTGSMYSGLVAVGDLLGAGSSASVGATGAVASVGSSSIGAATGGTMVLGTVTQNVTNTDSMIANFGAIGAGALSGTASSASLGASGAVASVGMSSINAGTLGGNPTVGAISQTVGNIGSASSVTNSGGIYLGGGITGNGASASVSATGAGAYVSFSTVR